ncbi:LysR family transcriptional regulator [Sphingomonas sp. Root710]|uniref:LysR family transcriptional regulator n=1 Tax=Sphingomonas sp. Root710 TaxID=1736594 RepID=UPI0009EB6CFD|nr:LysR family transcriptional regulator [Sphingomonas sp. Root710]
MPQLPRRRPEIRQLEIFLKVVETRNFAAAARQLGTSQPAISQTIGRLEEIVGADVFERKRGSPVELTPIGRAILPSARSLIHTIDQQLATAIATAQSRRGSLTVGFYTGLGTGPLCDGIAAFAAERPDVRLRLIEALPHELHRQLNERTIDVMFVALLPDLSSATIVQERLWDERMLVALPDRHPMASENSLGWDDIAKLRILMRANGSDQTGHHAVLARIGARPLDCEFHDVSRGALVEMVRMGLGATICVQSAANVRPGITYVPISGAKALVTIEAVWKRSDRNPIRHSLLKSVRDSARATHVDLRPFLAK